MSELRLRTYASVSVAISGVGTIAALPLHGAAEVAAMSAFFRGDPGLPFGAAPVTAAAALGGHRVISALGLHAAPADATLVVGISTGATQSGDVVDLVRFGPMTEPGWSWTPGQPLYIGAGGTLTQVAPTSGPLRVLGQTLSATRILVDLHPLILLS